MDESAVRGMALFKGKARCILCHNGPNFTDNRFYNLGVPQVGPRKEDVGRYEVTRMEHDKGAFKTPTLRSIAETAPYMHDGVFKTLEEVVDFLDRGGRTESQPESNAEAAGTDAAGEDRPDRVPQITYGRANQVRNAQTPEVISIDHSDGAEANRKESCHG
jgi:cytochrome c peroxidase